MTGPVFDALRPEPFNAWGIVLLAGSGAAFAVRAAGDLLNLSRLQGPPPEQFRDVVDEATHAKAQAYARARLLFGLAESAWGLAVFLAAWFLGWFAGWDRLMRGLGWAPLAMGLAYVGGLFFLQDAGSLPWQLYSTFVLEARFGFNRTTARTFALDKLKAWALTALLGGALLAALLAFFSRAGAAAWLWAWGTTTVFSLFLQFVAPTWIMPLFNKFTPLPDGELRASIFDLARRVSYPLTNIFVMDGSKRSSKTNAFFTGFGKNKRIALFDTLVRQHTVPELTAVMAHEIGHYKEGHVLVNAGLSILQQGALFYLLSLFLTAPGVFAAFGVVPSVHAGLVFFGWFFSPVSLLLGIGLHALSRRFEFQADRYALKVLGDPRPMADALKKLAVTNLAQLAPHPFYVWLHHTHPPLPARVAALERRP